jgi:hypothetical protein
VLSATEVVNDIVAPAESVTASDILSGEISGPPTPAVSPPPPPPHEIIRKVIKAWPGFFLKKSIFFKKILTF